MPPQHKLTFSYFQEWNSRVGERHADAVAGRENLNRYLANLESRGGPYTMQFLLRGDPPKASEARPHNMPLSNKPRLEVLPVLFIARDANWITESDIDLYSYLIFKHLELSQRYYKNQLGTDTFKIADEPVFVYRAQYDDAHYLAGHSNEKPSRQRANVRARNLTGPTRGPLHDQQDLPGDLCAGEATGRERWRIFRRRPHFQWRREHRRWLGGAGARTGC